MTNYKISKIKVKSNIFNTYVTRYKLSHVSSDHIYMKVFMFRFIARLHEIHLTKRGF